MITEKDNKYLRVAQQVAELSDYPQIKIGAVLVRRGYIVAIGCNKNKSHPVQAHWNRRMPYEIPKDRLHAEIDCLLHSSEEESKGATLYIFRRITEGTYRNCKPCEACMGMIKDRKIKRIVYSIEGGLVEETL